MMKEYYDILGIDEFATDEQVREAYYRVREKYAEERFMEGERGNEAAKQLTKIENAYNEIMAVRREKDAAKRRITDLKEVESLIKSGDLARAQEVLDKFDERSAEWHYLQSVLFYKKNWMNESKKQLEIAIDMDPTNAKYKQDFEKLKRKSDYNEQVFSGRTSYGAGGQQTEQNQQMGGTEMGGLCDFCTTLCCMNMLCNCLCR